MKLLEIIDRSNLGSWVGKKQAQIESTDPEKIYVENIRSFFGLSTKIAKLLCDGLVKERKLSKHIGYICANKVCKKMIFSEKYGNNLKTEEVVCENCEIRGEDEYSFNKEKLSTVVFYKLINNG